MIPPSRPRKIPQVLRDFDHSKDPASARPDNEILPGRPPGRVSAATVSEGQTAPAYGDRAVRWAAGALGVGVAAYAGYVAKAWYSYGKPTAAQRGETDSLFDGVMPEYDVAERHRIYVRAPAHVTLAAACEADMQQSPVVRAIFKAREWLLGTRPGASMRPAPLLAQVQSIGWRVLAESPGREIVLGAVTQPWMANVVFRGVSPDEFRAFQEPGFVKIAWTLRVTPLGTSASLVRTETRVATTDEEARRRFRWYWARFSPGILLIRYALLRSVKNDAERRVRSTRARDALPYEGQLDTSR